jgi:hypothetical protein
MCLSVNNYANSSNLLNVRESVISGVGKDTASSHAKNAGANAEMQSFVLPARPTPNVGN